MNITHATAHTGDFGAWKAGLARMALVLALALAALGPAAAPGAQAASPAERFVERVGNSVLAAARSGSVARFRAIVRKHADLATITTFSLGRHARWLSTGERRRFRHVVENMITDAFRAYSGYLRGSRVDATRSRMRNGRVVLVDSRIAGGGGGSIVWRLVRRGGGYRVVDLNVGGIWLSLQLRSMVQQRLGALGDARARL